MRKTIACLWLLVCCMACDEDSSIDPTLLPEATNTGEGTIGCLIDGWVYSGKRFSDPGVSLYQTESGDSLVLWTALGLEGETLSLSLINPKEGETVPYVDCYFNDELIGNGHATITRMSHGVLSGTFEGGRVTKGRFDVKFRE